MSKALDLAGRSFNRWSVISRAANRGAHAFWLCKCQCGAIKEVRASYLTSSHSKSCGCLSDEARNPPTSAQALTAEYLRHRMNYDPETGLFTWKVGLHAGQPAGCTKNSHGYVQIRFGPFGCRAHRLAWLYVHGEWPPQLIDHINGDRTDNRLCNLRLASPSVNMQNQRRATKNSSTGFLGVGRQGEKFTARINLRGKYTHLGTFKTAEEAHAAYVAAKRVYHEGCTL